MPNIKFTIQPINYSPYIIGHAFHRLRIVMTKLPALLIKIFYSPMISTQPQISILSLYNRSDIIRYKTVRIPRIIAIRSKFISQIIIAAQSFPLGTDPDKGIIPVSINTIKLISINTLFGMFIIFQKDFKLITFQFR